MVLETLLLPNVILAVKVLKQRKSSNFTVSVKVYEIVRQAESDHQAKTVQ